MGRIKKARIIQMAPNFGGFKPLGVQGKTDGAVCVKFEEYEALKLCDYELLTQADAAILMNISRPTFTRIYESARRKIATAFVEGRCIQFEGGNVAIDSWYRCIECKISFTLPELADKHCPFCKSKAITENN